MSELVKLKGIVRKKFCDLRPGVHRLSFDMLGVELDVRVRIASAADILICSFHGAIDRARRKPPIFHPIFKAIDNAHQISFSDPSLPRGASLSIAWYAGDAGFDTQDILSQLIQVVAESLGVARTVYLGSSGGGFAALYFSHQHPGSIVIANNPQVRILNYSDRLVTLYRQCCWPSLETNKQLLDVACVDLPQLYSNGHKNTVIYLQSMGDRAHFNRHMIPFASAIGNASSIDQFLLHTHFPGQMGHVQTLDLLRAWADSVCSSPTVSITDLLETWHRLQNVQKSTKSILRKSEGRQTTFLRRPTTDAFDPNDLKMADELRDWNEAQTVAKAGR